YLDTHTCMCKHTHIHTHTHTHSHVHTDMHSHAYTHACTHTTYTYMHTQTHAHTYCMHIQTFLDGCRNKQLVLILLLAPHKISQRKRAFWSPYHPPADASYTPPPQPTPTPT